MTCGHAHTRTQISIDRDGGARRRVVRCRDCGQILGYRRTACYLDDGTIASAREDPLKLFALNPKPKP